MCAAARPRPPQGKRVRPLQSLSNPVHALRSLTAPKPETPQGAYQAQSGFRIVVQSPVQCGAEIVVLGSQARQPLIDLRIEQLGPAQFGEAPEICLIRALEHVPLAGAFGLLAAVLANSLEQAIARPCVRGFHGDQGLIDQLGQQVQNVQVGANGLCRLKGPAA